jgi:hypothetical protein
MNQSAPTSLPPTIARWIKTDCGRSQYLELAARPGPGPGNRFSEISQPKAQST